MMVMPENRKSSCAETFQIDRLAIQEQIFAINAYGPDPT